MGRTESKNIGLVLDAGHKLGLHGYDHYNWMNHLDSKSMEEIGASMIARRAHFQIHTARYFAEQVLAWGAPADRLKLQDEHKRKKFGKKGCWLAQKHSWKTVAEQTDVEYQQVLSYPQEVKKE